MDEWIEGVVAVIPTKTLSRILLKLYPPRSDGPVIGIAAAARSIAAYPLETCWMAVERKNKENTNKNDDGGADKVQKLKVY